MPSLPARPRCSTHRFELLQPDGGCLLCRGAAQARGDRKRAAKAAASFQFHRRRNVPDLEPMESDDDQELDEDSFEEGLGIEVMA